MRNPSRMLEQFGPSESADLVGGQQGQVQKVQLALSQNLRTMDLQRSRNGHAYSSVKIAAFHESRIRISPFLAYIFVQSASDVPVSKFLWAWYYPTEMVAGYEHRILSDVRMRAFRLLLPPQCYGFDHLPPYLGTL